MDILPYNFRTCQICGMWYENNNFCILKMIYRVVVLFIIIQFTMSQVAELITTQGSIGEFTEVLFLSLTFAALCMKCINFVTRREEMVNLLKDFRSEICQPQSPEEKLILKDCLSITSKMFLSIMTMSQSTGLVLLILPFLNPENELQLPFKSYQPYNTSSTINFWITYTLQILAAIYGVLLNVSMDTMVYGFIIMATGQFKLNSYRLAKVTGSLKDHINHHVLIQDIVFKVQCFFIGVIVPLFFFSLITLCTSIFQMSQKNPASFEFLSLTMYLGCMLCQVFLYCFFGNELELQSKAVMDAVYSSNWSEFTNKEKQNMWLIMLSANRGSNISFHGQCGLTLNTFLWIVKTSYAALNLLQQASGEKM